MPEPSEQPGRAKADERIAAAIDKLIEAINQAIEEAADATGGQRISKLSKATDLAKRVLELRQSLREQQLAGDSELSPYQRYLKDLAPDSVESELVALREEVRRYLEELTRAGRPAGTASQKP